ncbi:putative reverse transcriptase domain-containing protein [Tanacetum coccineum]
MDISIAYHPQTDGQSERTMKTLEDMHSACTIDFEGNWDTHLPLVEFSYSNGYHQSVNCAPFEALYGRRCRLGKACLLESPTRTKTYLGTRRRDEAKVSATWTGVRDEAKVSATVRERYGSGRATKISGRNSLSQEKIVTSVNFKDSNQKQTLVFGATRVSSQCLPRALNSIF